MPQIARVSNPGDRIGPCRAVSASIGCLLCLACGPDRSTAATSRPVVAPTGSSSAAPPIASPASDGAPAFCARAGDDAVRDVFCQSEPAKVLGLSDLQRQLGVDFSPPDGGASAAGYGPTYTSGLDFRAVLLDHSTALSGALVSPINPRAIIVGGNMLMAFTRGTQEVELVAHDRSDYHLTFYLVTFEQACNAAPGGCSPADLFTPRIESNWTSVVAREAEELKNTPSDCRQCHERGLDAPILLMRELDGPWTHFFAPNQDEMNPLPEPSGSELVRDFFRAKDDEPYAGMPSTVIGATIGLALENIVDFPQPVVFDGSTILSERWPYANGYPTTPSRSAAWYAAYEGFKRGENLVLPHFDPRPTDPAKQAALTAAYQRYRSDPSSGDLPDLADIFPDDPQMRAEIGLQTEPGATPAQALVQACGTCHNDVLDQGISRARFNIDIARMSRAELDVAIERLRAPRGSASSMPPPGRRQLDDQGRAKLGEYLAHDVPSPEDDAFLQRAAHLGMAGHVEAARDPLPPL